MPAQSVSFKDEALYSWIKDEAKRKNTSFSDVVVKILDNHRQSKLIGRDSVSLEKDFDETQRKLEIIKHELVNARVSEAERAREAERDAELILNLERMTPEQLTSTANDAVASMDNSEKLRFYEFLRARELKVGMAYLEWVKGGRLE